MNIKKKVALAAIALASVIGVSACNDQADVVSNNISNDANNFKVLRRIVMSSDFTGKPYLAVEGWCNIVSDNTDHQLEVTCKVGNAYQKHYFGLSGTSSYIVEQLNTSNVSADHFVVTFRPETLIPDLRIT